MSTRHYGLKVGMKVSYPNVDGSRVEGEIIELSFFDNNGAWMRTADGTISHVICEWCKIIKGEVNEQSKTKS